MEFLWDMIYEAAEWHPEGSGSKPPREEVLSDPSISHYVEGWGRAGDAAVVAIDSTDGGRIGAAWYRLMSSQDPGYGFVDASTPEVAIAVVPDRRGIGVGGALLHALLDTARLQGFGTLSLSVERDNPAAKLYERNGFVKLFPVEGSWTMKVDLSEWQSNL